MNGWRQFIRKPPGAQKDVKLHRSAAEPKERRAGTCGTKIADRARSRVLKRGNPKTPAEEVLPGLVAILQPNPIAGPKPLAKSTGRRRWLADWLTRPDHPLTARVIVNRVWQWHFGDGLVATENDFGVMGEAPSHPELLDWLAREFVASGWRLAVTQDDHHVAHPTVRGS